MDRVSALVTPPSWTTAYSLIASKYCSNLPWSWPPSAAPNWLYHGLQLYLQMGLITASKFARLWPPIVSRNSLNYCFKVHISKLAQSWPPNASPNSINNSRQVCRQTRSITVSKFSQSWAPSAYLQTRLITASRCISKLSWWWPPSVSPNLLDYALPVHLQPCSFTIAESISMSTRSQPASVCPNMLDFRHKVHLHTYSTTALECISEFTWSWCCEMVELEGRQPNINTPPHLT